jgi:hypothetical protein
MWCGSSLPASIGEFGVLDGVVLHEPRPGAEPAAEQPTADEVRTRQELAGD